MGWTSCGATESHTTWLLRRHPVAAGARRAAHCHWSRVRSIQLGRRGMGAKMGKAAAARRIKVLEAEVATLRAEVAQIRTSLALAGAMFQAQPGSDRAAR